LSKKLDSIVEDIYRVVEGKGGWDATVTEFQISSITEVSPRVKLVSVTNSKPTVAGRSLNIHASVFEI
jgi:hypothetical protein